MLCLGTRCLMSVAFAAALVSVPAFAQTSNSRITGVIRDSVGAPREGATVRATNDATGITRSATTRADGSYTVSGLTPGVYTVSASLIGFRRAARTNLQLDQDATVDLVVAPLPLQAITVTATLREEALSDVPFSVAAPTADDLRERGAQNIEEIAANVAGFSVQNLGPGQSQVAIRGASVGPDRARPARREGAGRRLSGRVADLPVALHARPRPVRRRRASKCCAGRRARSSARARSSGTVRYITNQPELGLTSTFGEVGTSQVLSGGVGANVKLGATCRSATARRSAWRCYYNQLGGLHGCACSPTSRRRRT